MERLSQDAEAFCPLMAELGAEDACEGIKIVGVCGTLWEKRKCYKEKEEKVHFLKIIVEKCLSLHAKACENGRFLSNSSKCVKTYR